MTSDVIHRPRRFRFGTNTFRASYRACFVLASACTLIAVNVPSGFASDDAPGQVAKEKLTSEELADWIDRHFEQAWNDQGIIPAPITNDSEFVRRVFLDLIGRVPSVAETREFLEDVRPNKRRLLVDELLQRGAFANHLANLFRDQMLSGSSAQEVRGLAPALETWLKLRFTANIPYDQVVMELLTTTVDRNVNQLNRKPSPLAFYQAAEFKPEQLAANASRVFLGIQVQCAECHDHPFAEWKQPQFWSFAAFFKNADAQRADGAMMMGNDDADGIKIPGKDVLVPAVFLDGSKPVPLDNETRRHTVARWMTSPQNPYFAKAAINRIWGSYVGHGFVQPLDDLDPSHPPIYPEVFDALCTQFQLHHYDLKYVVRVISSTKLYQLSCRGAPQEGEDPLALHFARMPLRRLTGDQVYASFVQATGFRDTNPNGSDTVAREEFREKFADSATSPTEIKTTILQALSLMNGRHITAATDLDKSEFLSVVAEAPFLDWPARVETLFVAAFSRSPNSDEIELFQETPSADSKKSLADLFWILLNSAEFLLNH